MFYFSLEPSICSTEVHIRDSIGAYSKTVCEVRQIISLDQARAGCLAKGMQLFKAASQQELNAVTENADCVFRTGFLWIDGMKNGANCDVLLTNAGSYFYRGTTLCSQGWYYYCEYKLANKVIPLPMDLN